MFRFAMLRRLSRWGLVLALVLFAAGCAAGSAWPLLLSVLLSLGTLAFAGCGESHSPVGDADTTDSEEGTYEECCLSGIIDSCYCPPHSSCNYGWFTPCGEGTCVNLDMECPGADGGVVDADVPDSADTGPADDGGTFETCCVDGVVDTCYCPAGAECNYGLFDYCDDGSCVYPGGDCPSSGSGPVDAGTPMGDAS